MPAAARGRPGSWRLEINDALPSTNDHCIARAEAGEPDGLAVLARRQTRARGSRGRSWSEPDAGNLALSVLLRPEVGPDGGSVGAAEAGAWPFVAGLALHDGLEAVSTAGLVLKWPNDLLLGGRKLAGILIERGFGPDGTWMVIGFGANLRAAPVLPDREAACLAEAGPAPRQEDAAAAVLAALDRWRAVLRAEGFAPIRAAWLERAHPVGTRLLLDGPGDAAGSAPGVATGNATGNAPGNAVGNAGGATTGDAAGDGRAGARSGARSGARGDATLAIGASGAQREGWFSGLAPDGALLVLVDGGERRVETGDVLLSGGA